MFGDKGVGHKVIPVLKHMYPYTCLSVPSSSLTMSSGGRSSLLHSSQIPYPGPTSTFSHSGINIDRCRYSYFLKGI